MTLFSYNPDGTINEGERNYLKLRGTGIGLYILGATEVTQKAQENIDSKQQINIYFGKSGNEEKAIILLDNKKRLIKTYEDLDVTIIQILREDNIKEKRFLYPDLNYKNTGFSIYKDSQVFTAGYPNVEFYKEGRHISSGVITKIVDQFNFEHNCDTRKGSSGSPIINLFKLVIGIHFGGDKKNEKNFGTFIGAIIDKIGNEEEKFILNKEEEKPKKRNNEIVNFFKNNIEKDDEAKNAILNLFNNKEYLHHARKMFNDPKVANMLNKMDIFKKNLPFNNFTNDMMAIFDEDNPEDFNDLKNALENKKNEKNNKLNEEDEKDKYPNEYKEN